MPDCCEHAEHAGSHPTTDLRRQVQTRRGEHQPVHDPIEHRVEKRSEPAPAVRDPGDLTIGAVEDARQLHRQRSDQHPARQDRGRCAQRNNGGEHGDRVRTQPGR